MSDWKHTTEEGQDYWVSEQFGNIVKITSAQDGKDYFIGMIPKVVKLGPFEDIEQAKKAVEQSADQIGIWLDRFNENMLELLNEEGE